VQLAHRNGFDDIEFVREYHHAKLESVVCEMSYAMSDVLTYVITFAYGNRSSRVPKA
jgi:hypothetical protein